ncbi:MAG: endonuclease/exonuclease/phosphatase family protein [Phycisphaerales bacterium]
MAVRVATFNVENLFARYRFRSNFDPLVANGFMINDTAFDIQSDESKRITAKAIREIDADIVCLQEIENLTVLERFNSQRLGGMDYTHRMLVDSHDPRQIDVAVLSRFPITYIQSHRQERNAANTSWLFSRDCLEIDIDVNGKTLSLYINHFKSMIGGRDATRDRRLEQVGRTREIIDGWWQPSNFEGNYAVLGDFNDYPEDNSSLAQLLDHPNLVNVVERLPADERWTHFFAGGNEYRQLDFILLSETLADANANMPEIMRKGLPWRADRYAGERFPEVGERVPKASDHAPLVMELELV